jgi:hypothetical protein
VASADIFTGIVPRYIEPVGECSDNMEIHEGNQDIPLAQEYVLCEIKDSLGFGGRYSISILKQPPSKPLTIFNTGNLLSQVSFVQILCLKYPLHSSKRPQEKNDDIRSCPKQKLYSSKDLCIEFQIFKDNHAFWIMLRGT